MPSVLSVLEHEVRVREAVPSVLIVLEHKVRAVCPLEGGELQWSIL